MTAVHSHSLLRLAERAALEITGPSDADLVERFVALRDEAAFELLVRRHGGMVYRVCRARLGRDADAEDVFQATFLVLARAAGRIRTHSSLAGWLYRVAVRLSNRLRSRMRLTVELPAAPAAIDGDPARLAAQREEMALLWAEIDRLPERYRDAVLLCLIEGKSRKQAARELDCPGGTIDSRLAWARRRLSERLQRRGLAPAAIAGLTAALAADAPAAPARLAPAISRLALLFAAHGPAALHGLASPQTVHLLQNVGFIMAHTRFKVALALAIALGIAGIMTQGRLDRPATADDTPRPAAERPAPSGDWRLLGSWRVGQMPVTCLMFAPGSQLLIVNGGAPSAPDLRFLALPSGKITATWSIDAPLRSAAISPDGKFIATSEASGRMIVRFGTAEPNPRAVQVGEDRISALAFAPDGQRLFFGTTDGVVSSVELTRSATGALLLGKDFGRVDALSFTPDGKRLYTTGDGTVSVWDAATGKKIAQTDDWNRGRRDTAVSPDGRFVAVAGPTHVALLETATGKIVREFETSQAGLRGDRDICCVAFTPDGRTLVIGCNPYLSDDPAGLGEVRFLDVATGKRLGGLRLPAGFVVRATVSPNGKYLAVGGHDGVVHVWERAAAPSAPTRAAGSDRLDRLTADLVATPRSDGQCTDAVFLAALGRFPTETERQFAVSQLSRAANRREALRDLVFQLTATREFAEHLGQLQAREPRPGK